LPLFLVLAKKKEFRKNLGIIFGGHRSLQSISNNKNWSPHSPNMKFLLLTITLSMTYAMETTISGGAQEEEAPVMVPKAEWARDAHDTPGTLVDGRIKVNDPQSDEATGTTGGATGGTTGGATGGMTGGATGGMARGMTGGEDSATGESGLVNNPKEPVWRILLRSTQCGDVGLLVQSCVRVC
jgi:hypothetical protein